MRSEEKSSGMRIGYVSDYDSKRHMARVIFPELDEMVSGWLQVIVPNSKRNHDEHHLDIGEHVVCMMQGSGTESGIVFGSVYDDKNIPPEGNPDIRKITFDDGTVITIDRANHVCRISDSFGSVIVMANGDIKLTDSTGSIIEMSDGGIELKPSDGGSMKLAGEAMSLSGMKNLNIEISEAMNLTTSTTISLNAARIELNAPSLKKDGDFE